MYQLLPFFDVLAAVVFAVSGALVASRKRPAASVLGACAYVALDARGVGRVPGMSAGFLVTACVRCPAIKYGWSLPAFDASAKRERWKRRPKAP